ncbi:MAG: sensor histidine kinase [Planctomycetota bacterium]
MQWLPPLPCQTEPLLLPMADGSAAALADVLVAVDSATSASTLSTVLESDPPLLSWVCMAMCAEAAASPQSAGAAARWMIDRGAKLLEYPPDFCCDHAGSAIEEKWALRVSQALARAHQAAASSRSPEASTTAFLRAILRCALEWFKEHPDGQTIRRRLCNWAAIPSAVEVYPPGGIREPAEHRLTSSPNDDSTAIAHSAAGRWKASLPWLIDLRGLVRRLARLQTLETHFAEQLEAEKMAALAEFAAGAGHEINNPLGVIAGRAQILLAEEQDPERRRALALISAQAMRIHEMIADLRLFARPPTPDFQRVDAASLVSEVVASMAAQAREQSTGLLVADGSTAVSLWVDPDQFRGALGSVIRNALEALHSGGGIRVRVAAQPGWLVVSVVDTGPGMRPDERQHALEPYYSARQAGRGLGLGLSKAWRIVTQHGGELRIRTARGEGCCVDLWWPMRRSSRI